MSNGNTHRSLGFFIAGLVAGMVIVGGVAIAAVPSSSTGRISACYSTSGATKGTVRVIDADQGETCRTGERSLSWAQRSLRFRGAWSATTRYFTDDVVLRSGSSYVAIATSTNVTPPNGTKWSLLAARGSDGQNGTAGQDGVDASLVLGGQACEPPYVLVGYDAEGTVVCNSPVDADGDGYSLDRWDTDPLLSEDCDDSDSGINPGAEDIPLDRIDQDCDGTDAVPPPPNCDDQDPYTSDSYDPATGCVHIPQSLDLDSDGWSAQQPVGGSPDCDDTTFTIRPGATEVLGDGVDQNCDGTAD